MDITPFTIQLSHNEGRSSFEIRPCCNEDNVVDYAVWAEDRLLFTLTRQQADKNRWVIALKNADDHIPDEEVQLIGAQIDKHNSNLITP